MKRSMLILSAFTIFIFGACSAKRYNGDFTGELKSEASRGDGAPITIGGAGQSESDLKVKLTQSGDRVAVEISRSRLLGDCELYARVSKNGTAYLETPQTCTESLPLEGTVDVITDELNLVLRGFDSASTVTFRFKGYRR